ncbi:hypothetical protein ACFL27_08335 [candidate division CSSED10-310 bacterium]|uniref:D-proline reductase (Dithiol) PrdB n=1 Tax=candidate division CSSED10-310 bacterium TaxID=2855610 RepID=A0ABV6YVU4_UNCC1
MVEASGIPTISLSINRPWSEKVEAPRTVFVHFPYGAPFGEPGIYKQHLTILRDLLHVLQSAQEPGQIVDLPYKWKRTQYDQVPYDSFEIRPAGAASQNPG